MKKTDEQVKQDLMRNSLQKAKTLKATTKPISSSSIKASGLKEAGYKTTTTKPGRKSQSTLDTVIRPNQRKTSNAKASTSNIRDVMPNPGQASTASALKEAKRKAQLAKAKAVMASSSKPASTIKPVSNVKPSSSNIATAGNPNPGRKSQSTLDTVIRPNQRKKVY